MYAAKLSDSSPAPPAALVPSAVGTSPNTAAAADALREAPHEALASSADRSQHDSVALPPLWPRVLHFITDLALLLHPDAVTEMINAGAMPLLAKLLEKHELPAAQFEAACMESIAHTSNTFSILRSAGK
jgi:hypothetical protein